MTSLARLVEPVDATRAILHDVDDVYDQRAGAHAVAVALQHCAATGRAYWGWSAWDWASVCGASSQAFRAAQPLPTETMVRPFVMAFAYLLGEFSEYQHLGTCNWRCPGRTRCAPRVRKPRLRRSGATGTTPAPPRLSRLGPMTSGARPAWARRPAAWGSRRRNSSLRRRRHGRRQRGRACWRRPRQVLGAGRKRACSGRSRSPTRDRRGVGVHVRLLASLSKGLVSSTSRATRLCPRPALAGSDQRQRPRLLPTAPSRPSVALFLRPWP